MKEEDLTPEGRQYLRERYLKYMSMECDEIYIVPEGRVKSRHEWAMDEAWDDTISAVYIGEEKNEE